MLGGDKRQSVEELESEIKKIQERQEKYGTQTEESLIIMERLQRRLDFARHKEAPKPILKGSTLLEDTIYLYGVDYMSTSDIKGYFERFTTNNDGEQLVVAWIDDSSCTVKFESTE